MIYPILKLLKKNVMNILNLIHQALKTIHAQLRIVLQLEIYRQMGKGKIIIFIVYAKMV